MRSIAHVESAGVGSYDYEIAPFLTLFSVNQYWLKFKICLSKEAERTIAKCMSVL